MQVTGKIYEFNTWSGARRWKKSSEPLQPTLAMQVTSGAKQWWPSNSGGQDTGRAEAPSKKETSEKRKEPTTETKKEPTTAAKPSAGPSQTPGQDGVKVQKQK